MSEKSQTSSFTVPLCFYTPTVQVLALLMTSDEVQG